MLVVVGFIGCEMDDGFKNSQHQNKINLKTVNPTDAAKAFKEANSKKSEQSWITPYFQYNDSIGLNNSSAQITVTPVITSVTNAYSRLFSIEINGNLESVLYHMIPNDQSSPTSFWGKVVITDLSGDMLSAFDVEDNLYTGYYDIINHPETINILEKANNKLNKNGEGDGGGDEGNNNDNVDDPCDGCAWQDELGAVTVTAPGMTENEVEIIIIFLPEIYPNHGQDGGVSTIPDNTPQSPSTPAGGTNNESCPPGQIKDDNGDCVDPPEEEEVECDPGYTPDKDGNCKKIPCEGNPVASVEIAPQNVSGTLGGMFGCNRYGGTCNGSGGRNKNHAGIDIKNPHGAPVFAMYNGTVYNTPYDPDGAGYMVQIQSTLPNGEVVITTYFHLQEDNRIQAGTAPLTQVTAGQIIGYQGDSGNLAGAIADGDTESHVHIETRLHDGSSSWNFNNNFDLVDPRNYLETNIDETGDINNDCN